MVVNIYQGLFSWVTIPWVGRWSWATFAFSHLPFSFSWLVSLQYKHGKLGPKEPSRSLEKPRGLVVPRNDFPTVSYVLAGFLALTYIQDIACAIAFIWCFGLIQGDEVALIFQCPVSAVQLIPSVPATSSYSFEHVSENETSLALLMRQMWCCLWQEQQCSLWSS